MPIHTELPIKVLDQASFHAIDEVVTGLAFDIHNEFGRYLDERLYQAELLQRLRVRGFVVAHETKIAVSLESFSKDYFVDFLINSGVIVETKSVETLAPSHRAQLMTYLFLCGLHHGTLLNFRPERLQHEFVSTQFTPSARRDVSYDPEEWRPFSKRCPGVMDTLRRALAEWGACLAPALYRDVITHFLGGEERVVREIPVLSGETSLGVQKVHLVTDDVAFSVTTSVHRPDAVWEHQRRFPRHTRLRAIQWINLDRLNVSVRTLTK